MFLSELRVLSGKNEILRESMCFYSPLPKIIILILLTPPVFWVNNQGKLFFTAETRRVFTTDYTDLTQIFTAKAQRVSHEGAKEEANLQG